MRFLTGLITGAILTFGIATAIGVPTHRITDLVPVSLDWMREQTVPLVLPDVTGSETVESEVADGEPAPENSEQTVPEPFWVAAENSNAESVEQLHDLVSSQTDQTDDRASDETELPLEEAEQTESLETTAASLAQVDPLASESEEGDKNMSGNAEIMAVSSYQQVADDPGRGMETVWVPFASQRSAAGFAEHVSEALSHPFEVERERAGRYHVAFAYQSPEQRDRLLMRLREITGSDQ
jgi:hypothetical protein